MNHFIVLFALILILGGLWQWFRPVSAAETSEKFDAIGRKQSLETVEPSRWAVNRMKIGGGLMIIIGVLLVLLR